MTSRLVLTILAIVATASVPLAAATDNAHNLLSNGDFEKGLAGWSQCGAVAATISHHVSHAGASSARMGSTSVHAPEIRGDALVCRKVALPDRATLSYWARGFSSESSAARSWQEAGIIDGTGAKARFFKSAETFGWRPNVVDLSPYAGQTVTLFFGVHGNGSSAHATFLYVDDVVLAAAQPVSAPSESPEVTAPPTTGPSPAPGPSSIATASPPASCANHGCGVERWHVKTLSDPQAGQVSLAPQDAAISQLRAMAYPGGNPKTLLQDDHRYPLAELQMYRITAVLTAYKAEADQDIHLALTDANDSSVTMIAEIPNPDCSGVCSSQFHDAIASVRSKFEHCVGPAGSTYTSPSGRTLIEVTGVGFFDKVHGQRGVAPNGIELHPVLGLRFPQTGCN
jgi:hypothetical protein